MQADKKKGHWFIIKVENRRKPKSTQSCLRVVVMFSFFDIIVYSCNQTSTEEKKVTVMLP